MKKYYFLLLTFAATMFSSQATAQEKDKTLGGATTAIHGDPKKAGTYKITWSAVTKDKQTLGGDSIIVIVPEGKDGAWKAEQNVILVNAYVESKAELKGKIKGNAFGRTATFQAYDSNIWKIRMDITYDTSCEDTKISEHGSLINEDPSSVSFMSAPSMAPYNCGIRFYLTDEPSGVAAGGGRDFIKISVMDNEYRVRIMIGSSRNVVYAQLTSIARARGENVTWDPTGVTFLSQSYVDSYSIQSVDYNAGIGIERFGPQ